MRGLVRNQKPFWYAVLESVESVTDSSGYETGERVNKYSKPVKAYGNVSFPKGTAALAAGNVTVDDYGMDISYNRVLILYDMDCPIAEDSLIWLDTEPAVDSNGYATTPADHRIKRIVKTLNCISYGLRLNQ